MNTPTGRTPADTPNMQSLPTGSEEGKRVAAAFRPKIADEPPPVGHITIGAKARFRVAFLPQHIGYFMQMSSTHYDGRCQKASMPGGFIHGWQNWAKVCPEATCAMDMDELDTLMKICENIRVLQDPSKIGEVMVLMVLFNRAFTVANQQVGAIKIELDPQTKPGDGLPRGWTPF